MGCGTGGSLDYSEGGDVAFIFIFNPGVALRNRMGLGLLWWWGLPLSMVTIIVGQKGLEFYMKLC